MGAVFKPSGSSSVESWRRGLEDLRKVEGSGGALRLEGIEGTYASVSRDLRGTGYLEYWVVVVHCGVAKAGVVGVWEDLTELDEFRILRLISSAIGDLKSTFPPAAYI